MPEVVVGDPHGPGAIRVEAGIGVDPRGVPADDPGFQQLAYEQVGHACGAP
ncbi:hypothetical protein [Streptomyces sp. Ncost-T10-10d]|uniref:hypothetical protein n=1 Tax=Streptomyces sp. Ncost-T10-10d TaxID=1839774 RepID=UPI00081E7876|nr:hypothetical protein [Streptomyces sp. Ncost-T10-10d]SCF83228.1 hypothetical protein GA0115254_118563 [Streptomyces sp. Ncost-T10-10d]